MKILVIGGSGFIGTNLVRVLTFEGHEVIIYDKVISESYPNSCIQADVRDLVALTESMRNVDVVYNLAAEHKDDVRPKKLYYEVNVVGAENIVKAAQQNNIKKIIFTSSVAVYGLNVGIPDENYPIKPFNDYGNSKYKAECVFSDWEQSSKKNILLIVRPVVIFGDGNRGNVFNLLNQIYSNRFIMVGNGKNKKSMGYVKNIASFLQELVNINSSNIYNYSDSPDLQTNELMDISYDALGVTKSKLSFPYHIGMLVGYLFDVAGIVTRKQFSISSIRIKKFCSNTQVNSQKISDAGFKKKYSLEEGLRNMIANEFISK